MSWLSIPGFILLKHHCSVVVCNCTIFMVSVHIAFVGWCFYLYSVLFIYDSEIQYIPDKCGVINKILEQAIFIFKSNTNKISIHINVEIHNNFDPIYTNEILVSAVRIISVRFGYYRVTSSLLVLVRYLNPGDFRWDPFSVSENFSVHFQLWRLKYTYYLIARGRTPCLGPWGCGENA